MDQPVADTAKSPDGDDSPPPTSTSTTCPECETDEDVERDSAGERYCSACGYILEESAERSFRSPGAREFGDGFDHSNPVDSVVSRSRTYVGGDYVEYTSTEHARRLKSLRKWDQRFRLRGSREQTLEYAVSEIQRMCTSLGLPEPVRQTAGVLFKQAQDTNLHHGFSSEPVITASVYHAATLEKQPRRVSSVVEVSKGVDQDTALRAMRRLNQELNLRLAPVRPNDYLARMATDLDVPNTVRRDAQALLEKLDDQDLAGHKATTITAAALYHASLSSDVKQLTQDEVASNTDLSIGTLSRIYSRLFKK